MPDMFKVASVADVPPGEVRVVEAGAKPIALVNVEGTFYAMDNTCLHRGGPLGEGDLEGTVLTCPWHGWRWDVRSGASVNNPAVTVSCFRVMVDAGSVYVEV